MEKRKGRKREGRKNEREQEKQGFTSSFYSECAHRSTADTTESCLQVITSTDIRWLTAGTHMYWVYSSPHQLSLVWRTVCIITRSMLVQCAPA